MNKVLLHGFSLLHQHVTDGVGIFLYNEQLQITDWSQAMTSLTGLSREDCLGQKVHDVINLASPAEIDIFCPALKGSSYVVRGAVLEQQEQQQATQQAWDLHFCPLEAPEKNTASVLVLMMPAETVKKRVDQKLICSTLATIDDFLNYAPIPIFIVDAKLNVTLANKAFYSFIEKPAETAKNLSDFVPSHLLEPLKDRISFVMQYEKPLTYSEDFRLKRGIRHLYNIVFPLRNAAGTVNAVGGYLIDMTPQVEQQLQNEQLLAETLRLNEALSLQNKEMQLKQAALDEANKALLEQKQELEDLVSELSDRNYELDQIMYKTSHDLRAPLTSILGLLQLARQEKDASKLPEYHQYIENRVNKLDDFVKTMLTYAKTSRTDINLEAINWPQLVQESLEQVQYLEHYNKINIQLSINADLYSFASDPMRVIIILNNLIGNAIKYADIRKPEPFVKVRINNSGKGASIEVEDNGIGIPEVYINKVCDMFFRATDSIEGSGLGLYIVKQTIERLKGRLLIESKQREGTTMAVFLPHLSKHQRLKTVKPNSQANKKNV